MKGTRSQINHRSLAFIVLIAGVVGGLLIVFSILLLCKYCLNRKSLREAEQMKLLYETLNQASLLDSNRFYYHGIREFSALEPRRSNPLDRYQLPENLWQIPTSKRIPSPTLTPHNQSYHNSREHLNNQPHDPHPYRNIALDDEEAYLQVDPRCYVRQSSNASAMGHRKSETPRLEKGHSLNVDTRPSPSSTSLSPYRQSSFDVASAYRSQQQPSALSPATSTQHDIYYTPRGSSLSVVANPISNTPTGSQHLSPPTPSTSRKNSIAMIVDKKDVTLALDPFNQNSAVRSSAGPKEHVNSRSFEQSSTTNQPLPSPSPPPSNHTAVDKQSRSFDAVHLLRPGTNRADVVNRRTKSYEYADEHRPSVSSIAPAPIVIKIPDMAELVQAAQLSRLQVRRESSDMEEYQRTAGRKSTLVQQLSVNEHDTEHQNLASAASQDLWRLRQSYELEELQRQGQTSPEDFSPDLLTSTSIDSAGAMPIHNPHPNQTTTAGDDEPSNYQHRRKSSSNLLLPPPEVRRQALRRTFEKRRSCINQSNARREQQLLYNQTSLMDEKIPNAITDFSSLLNNFNSKSENSSFERSLETDFDMQSDTSSRGPNDQFTSIESSGNENPAPDVNHRVIFNRRQQQQQQQQSAQQQSPQISPHQDDSGYKSLESQNSQNRTFSLDWMSADGAESVIYVGDGRPRERSIDVKDLDDDLAQQQEQQQINTNRRSPKLLHTGLHHSYQETSTNLIPPMFPNSPMMQQRSLSTNIPLVDHYNDKPSPMNLSVLSITNPNHSVTNNNHKLVTSASFTRTASKKRREFSKDKRNVSSNVGLLPKTTDERQATVHQINETQPKPLTLQVRHPDLRRTKSDEARNPHLRNTDGSSTKESTPRPDEMKSNNRLSSSTDGIILSSSPPLSLNPVRQHLSPNGTTTSSSRHSLHRSPSSTTPTTVASSPQTDGFRSQRGSVSFDTQTSFSSSPPTTNKSKASTAYSIFPAIITKPRLKFSMVRDTAMAGLGHSAPVYAMPIARDYSIDERTNRIVNEFLMHDPLLDDRKHVHDDNRGTSKRHHHHHHHRIRPKTFDETTASMTPMQKQSRSMGNKQRYHHSLQANMRKHSQHQYPSVHLPESIEQDEEEEDSSDPASPLVTLNQQSTAAARREISMAAASPSIIITGYDSGSQ